MEFRVNVSAKLLALLIGLSLLGFSAKLTAQCGVTIPFGQHCSPPSSIAAQTCYFWKCDTTVSGGDTCKITNIPTPQGTRCGLFGDECFDDFCNGLGACVFSFSIAPLNSACASDRNVCDGVSLCDGGNGLNCLGDTLFPASNCDDGAFCTENCNPIDTCVSYPFNSRCDDIDICTEDICDTTTSVPSCVSTCTGTPACAGSPACVGFPVELLNFTVWANGREVFLEWMSANEINNVGFDIEISVDGEMFIKAGFVEGKGTTSEAQFYSFQTEVLNYGDNYVRLKQWDTDGAFSYSPTLRVHAPQPIPYELGRAYPNPFRKTTMLSFSVSIPAHVRLLVYDQRGVLVRTLFEGRAEPTIIYRNILNAAGLTPGMYFYRLEGDLESDVRKLTLY